MDFPTDSMDFPADSLDFPPFSQHFPRHLPPGTSHQALPPHLTPALLAQLLDQVPSAVRVPVGHHRLEEAAADERCAP